MQIPLFFFYLVLLSLLITRSKFLLKSGLSKTVLICLFLLYGLAGCAHVIIALHFFPGHGDIWQTFHNSVALKENLLHDFPAFKQELFPDRFSIDLAGTHFGWSYYEQQGLMILHILFNFLSFNNIYINTLLFCFLTMFGKTALYRMIIERYPGREFAALVVVFLVPSVIFWTSVIHKEGVLFAALGTLLFCLHRRGITHRITAALMLLIIFGGRKILLVSLVPGLTIWWLGSRTTNRMLVVGGVCLAYIIFFAVLGYLSPSLNIMHQISARVAAYENLKGTSHIFLPRLDGSLGSLVKVAPYAVLNGLFMPIPGTGGNGLYTLFSFEIIIVWTALIRYFVKNKPAVDGFAAGLMFFALIGCIIIGYTVPFAGAIVRYRSIFYPFLLTPIFQRHIS